LTRRMRSHSELSMEILTVLGGPWGGRTMPARANALGAAALLTLLAGKGGRPRVSAAASRPGAAG
jgi:hypothetical protein